jgi:hypothetical protein
MKSETSNKSAAVETPAHGDLTIPRTRTRKTLQERMTEVMEQQAQLTAQRRALAAQQRAEARAREAELESIIGRVCRVDQTTHQIVRVALAKYVHDPKQQALLRTQGWL